WLARLGLPHPRLHALFGAGFLALSPVHVQHSHVTSPDVPTVAFIVLATYCVLRLLESGEVRWYLLGGVAIGLASAAKYPSAMFAVALVVAHLARAWLALRRPWTLPLALLGLRLWAAGLMTIGTCFATSPYILIDWQRFQTDFLPQANRAFQRGSIGGIGLSGPDAWYMFGVRVIQWGLDTPVAVLVAVGLVAVAILGGR